MNPKPHEVLAALLDQHGLQIQELPAETGTAVEAAKAVGVSTAQIVKSLVLVDDSGILIVLASGDRKIDLALLAARLSTTSLRMATGREVKAATGFAIGGVPPIGHLTSFPIYLDRRLLDQPLVYAAAGTPHRVFRIEPELLRRISSPW